MGTIVLTGASSGIGAAAAVELTRQGHEVLATGRSSERLAAVHRRMLSVAPLGLDVPDPVTADLSSLQEVRRLGVLILNRCERLDVLVNNAGVQPNCRQLSEDGLELTLAVNHLAPFLLTNILVERLRSCGGRVVTTSSSSHAKATLDLSDVQLERGWTSQLAYGRSKLANILFTIELRRRTGLPASSFHPGSVRTDLNRDSPFVRVVRPFERIVFATPKKGAQTLIWLTTGAEGAAPRAVYYAKGKPAAASQAATDRDSAARLWNASVELVGLIQQPASEKPEPA